MLDITCDKCGAMSVMDVMLTKKDYVENMEVLVTTDGKTKGPRPNIFYYKCTNCDSEYKLSTAEVLDKIQDVLINKAHNLRYEKAFTSFRQKDIKEESGIVYCGQCPGLDGEGSCFKDAYNVCNMRIK